MTHWGKCRCTWRLQRWCSSFILPNSQVFFWRCSWHVMTDWAKMFMTCDDRLRKVLLPEVGQIPFCQRVRFFFKMLMTSTEQGTDSSLKGGLPPSCQTVNFLWHVMKDWALCQKCGKFLSAKQSGFFKMLMTCTEQGTDWSLKDGVPPSCQTVNLLWHVMKDWAKCQFYWCSLIVVKSAWGGTTRIEGFFFTTWAASMEEGSVVPSQIEWISWGCPKLENRKARFDRIQWGYQNEINWKLDEGPSHEHILH